MNMNNIEFSCLFTTGRSDTALLSQVFGGNKWEKRKYHYSSNNLICHECWDTKRFRIDELKEEPSFTSNESLHIQKGLINQQLSDAITDFHGIKKYFVCDHRVGRYFSNYISSQSNSKIIYIERNINQVIDSSCKRWNDRLNRIGKDNFNRFEKRAWCLNLYQATDGFCITKMTDSEWNKLSLKEKLEWYCVECKNQWLHFKTSKPKANVYEINFADMVTFEGMNDMALFLDLPLYKDFLSIKVNDRNDILKRDDKNEI